MMGVVLLVVSYPVAVAVLARLRSVLVKRRVRWFVLLEAAMASIVAGWWLRGQPIGVVINGAALVGLGIAWWITGSRSRRPLGWEGRSGPSGHR